MRYIIIVFLFLASHLATAQSIRVGVYPNAPLIIIDDQGNISGFLIDLLKDIAEKEGWRLEFHSYDFTEGLLALEKGEIDIMPALAYSVQRDSTYIMNQTNVITNWAKIYKYEDDEDEYTSLEQLEGKKIAVRKKDYYLQNGNDGLLDLLNKLDINTNITEFSSYEAVINQVSDQKADLGLVSRYFGTLGTEERDVVKTPINVAYVSVRYGFHKNKAGVLLANRLDFQLQLLIRDRESTYYTSEKKYFSHVPQEFIPPWLWKVFALAVASLAILAIFIIILQHQVKRKTLALEESNDLLRQSEHQSRLAVQTIEASRDIGFWFQRDKPFIRVNKAAIRLTGFTEEELLKMVPRDLLASNVNQEYYESLRDESWDGHLLIEDTFKKKDGGVFPIELSLDQFELDGQTYIGGFARDITARVKAERQIISSILSTEDKERSRISKELHDSVGQTLSAISLHLDSLTNVQGRADQEASKIANIEKLVDEAITESRSISHNLMPPALSDLGYTFAVENLLTSLEGVGDTSFSFQSNEFTVVVAKDIEFALFRITQEAINNIIKYAEASEATIQYLVFDDLISLSIEDDGAGFDVKLANKNHNFGLNSMKNRAESLGGELTIDASPGKGTSIHVSIPLT